MSWLSMSMIVGLTVVAPAMLTTASAQPAQTPIDELVVSLAYEHCPSFLAGDMTLAGNDLLAGLGFAQPPEKKPNVRFGELQMVSAKLSDGEVSFGGAPEQTCTVVLKGVRWAAALNKLRAGLTNIGLKLALDPAQSGERLAGRMSVETYKGRADKKTMLNVQLIEIKSPPNETVMFQTFVTAE